MGARCCLPAFDRVRHATHIQRNSPDRNLELESTHLSTCSSCNAETEETARGDRGDILCRRCIRLGDQALLEPITQEERQGLDLLAGVLDAVSWKFWKPGQQPAQILDWMYLGDLSEAMNIPLLKKKNINAVLNLINWWELTARLPDIDDVPSFYASHGVDFLAADSEDRLFFDLVVQSWPEAHAFLQKCLDEGQRVLVNCKAGHNRSACVVVCWLMVHEKMSLLDAAGLVLSRRGTILSNHGFRLQLVRLALKLGQVGFPQEAKRKVTSPRMMPSPKQKGKGNDLEEIIAKKRLAVRYGYKPEADITKSPEQSICSHHTMISHEVNKQLNQRTLKLELLVCLYHQGKNFLSEYVYTQTPPKVIGSGFSGDVFLCQNREPTAVHQNVETSVRCVKTFNLKNMGETKLAKLKNEAVIYLTLEHPHIARLFDVYDDSNEVALVMQYCSGGTLERALQTRGAYAAAEFQEVAVQMLRTINFIHLSGIVHRDIKPRNWVYEADGTTVKLIDFGFSVKEYLSDDSGGLSGCMGTLGYLAPEVVRAGLGSDSPYNMKCDMWSLGVVFFELLTAQPAFHREQGTCDGYTQEVVLREIQDVTTDVIVKLLEEAPADSRQFLSRLLRGDPRHRSTAAEMLDDPYLSDARNALYSPRLALPIETVLERFRLHASLSKTSRSWLLAVARSPTYLPWSDFLRMRQTFTMFDAHGCTGMVSRENFVKVVCASGHGDSRKIEELWKGVCGEQPSMSYCEFLAVLLPPIEDDVFEDDAFDLGEAQRLSPRRFGTRWNPLLPISAFVPDLKFGSRVPIFDEKVKVAEVVRAMTDMHVRWVIVRYHNNRCAFFDYVDLNHEIVKRGGPPSEALKTLCNACVGTIANSSGFTAFVSVTLETPLTEVLRLISSKDGVTVRRVPVVDSTGEVIHVVSCLDLLNIMMKSDGPLAILQQRSVRTFDRRRTILKQSVTLTSPMADALKRMDRESLPICPVTSPELCGDMGGVLAKSVVSVSDLKLVIGAERFDILDTAVSTFMDWRSNHRASVDNILRKQRFFRYDVVSTDEKSSLYTLARRILESQLQRVFISSEELARIVGIVSSREVLLAVVDDIV